ncbi:MAG: hypothetical protein IT373_15250, partial [Polyangiaceae bacterium]|nr:hypothetical protein [Polyangiaceae bacterium]
MALGMVMACAGCASLKPPLLADVADTPGLFQEYPGRLAGVSLSDLAEELADWGPRLETAQREGLIESYAIGDSFMAAKGFREGDFDEVEWIVTPSTSGSSGSALASSCARLRPGRETDLSPGVYFGVFLRRADIAAATGNPLAMAVYKHPRFGFLALAVSHRKPTHVLTVNRISFSFARDTDPPWTQWLETNAKAAAADEAKGGLPEDVGALQPPLLFLSRGDLENALGEELLSHGVEDAATWAKQRGLLELEPVAELIEGIRRDFDPSERRRAAAHAAAAAQAFDHPFIAQVREKWRAGDLDAMRGVVGELHDAMFVVTGAGDVLTERPDSGFRPDYEQARALYRGLLDAEAW